MSETGLVTILFTDLVGSTELAARIGDAAADEVRREHFTVLREVLEQMHGEEVKSLGDGVMASFTSAVKAVECAVEMQRAVHRGGRRRGAHPLQVRVGVSAGEASLEDGDWFGRPVVEASRLCAIAGAGEILAAEVVRVLGGNRVSASWGQAEAMTLKGLPEPVAACLVGWEPDAGDLAPSPAVASAAAAIFVGRDRELQRLTAAWERAAAGEVQATLLAGEPGVGKTRLAAQAAMVAQAVGATVLFGRCDEENVVPYQPFVEALSHYISVCPDEELKEQLGSEAMELVRLLPELGRQLPGLAPDLFEEPDRFRLFSAVASLLRNASAARPVVLVLDDLHWADKPTLLLFHHLLRQPSPLALLVIATYRDTDLARTHPLAALLAQLRREPAVERISLRGLDEVDIAHLLEAVTGHELGRRGRDLARALTEETEGNPFFIGEIVRHLVEDGRVFQREGIWTFDVPVQDLGIPEGIREVIGMRLSQLSEATNRVLAEASVLGREFDFHVLEAMSAMDPEEVLIAIEDALAHSLIEEVPEHPRPRYAFTHALVRQTLYEELSLARKQRLHLRAAEALEQQMSRTDRARAALLAGHLRAAGAAADTDKALSYSQQAAAEAVRLFAWEDALGHLEAALEILEDKSIGGERRGRVLERLGDILVTAGFDHGRGVALLEEALGLFVEDGLEERAAVVHSRLGSIGWTFPAIADVPRALEHLRAAEAVLARGPDRRSRGYLAMGLAATAVLGMRPHEGLEDSGRAMQLGEETGDAGLWASAAALQGWALMCLGRIGDSAEILDRSWVAGEEAGGALPLFVAAWMAGVLYFMLYDPATARAWVERGLAHPSIRQAPARRSILADVGSGFIATGGDVGGALALLEELDAERYGVGRLVIEGLTGDRAAALEKWSAWGTSAAARGDLWDNMYSHVWTAPLLWELGEAGAAERTLRTAIAATEEAPVVTAVVMLRAMLAVILAEDGRAEEAAAEARGARALLTPDEDWRGLAGHCLVAEAAAEGAAQGWQEANALFDQAVAHLHRWGVPWREAEAARLWGRMLLRASDLAQASERLDMALEIYRSLGGADDLIRAVEADRP